MEMASGPFHLQHELLGTIFPNIVHEFIEEEGMLYIPNEERNSKSS